MAVKRGAIAKDTERVVVDVEPTTLAAIAAAFLGLVAFVGLVGGATRTMTGLAIAAILAIALDPVVTRIADRLQTRRGVAVALLALAAALAASLAAALIAPPTYRQANNLRDDLPEVVESMTNLPIVGGRLEDAGVPEKARKWIEELPNRLAGDTTPLRDAAGTAFNGATALLLVLLFTSALLIDGPFLVDHVRRAMPGHFRATARRGRR